MFKVSVYNKSKKMVAVYERIHTVNYTDVTGDVTTVSGEELLTHNFPTSCNYQLLSNDGNYSIDESVIGTFEVTRVVY